MKITIGMFLIVFSCSSYCHFGYAKLDHEKKAIVKLKLKINDKPFYMDIPSKIWKIRKEKYIHINVKNAHRRHTDLKKYIHYINVINRKNNEFKIHVADSVSIANLETETETETETSVDITRKPLIKLSQEITKNNDFGAEHQEMYYVVKKSPKIQSTDTYTQVKIDPNEEAVMEVIVPEEKGCRKITLYVPSQVWDDCYTRNKFVMLRITNELDQVIKFSDCFITSLIGKIELTHKGFNEGCWIWNPKSLELVTDEKGNIMLLVMIYNTKTYRHKVKVETLI